MVQIRIFPLRFKRNALVIAVFSPRYAAYDRPKNAVNQRFAVWRRG
jgi:hypothetical protein